MKILGTNGVNNVQIVNDYINTHEFPEIDLPLSEPVSLEDQRKQMQIIVEMESSHFQFYDTRYTYKPHGPNDVGYPNTQRDSSKAADLGLCQLNDWEPSLGVIWNWKTNINAGIHVLWGDETSDEKYRILKRKFNKIKDKHKDAEVSLTRKEFLIWLTQLYHAGHYYTDFIPGNKKGERGSWKLDPEYSSYGDKFCNKFGGWDCDN